MKVTVFSYLCETLALGVLVTELVLVIYVKSKKISKKNYRECNMVKLTVGLKWQSIGTVFCFKSVYVLIENNVFIVGN